MSRTTQPRGRRPRRFETAYGPRFRVRYRLAGVETSTTFRVESDADTFAAILNGAGGANDALAWIAERERNAETLTLGEWLPKYTAQLTAITPRTRAEYQAQADRYLGSIVDLPLPLITRTHIAAIVNDLEAKGRSPKTIKNLIHSLSSVMALAVEDGHIAKNPCRKVALPKMSLQTEEIRFLEEAEFGALHNALDPYYRALAAFLVGTGLRWSEATALQTRHVSLERGTVRVDRAWKWEGKGRGWAIGVPKSQKSKRTVNAAVLALAAVEPLLGKPDDPLFKTPTGLVVRHNNFYNRVWLPAREKVEMPKLRIHDLRHTHASWLISDGVSLEAVQDQLGHESIITTRKIYGHLLPAVGVETGKMASEALARALRDPVKLALPVGSVDVDVEQGSD